MVNMNTLCQLIELIEAVWVHKKGLPDGNPFNVGFALYQFLSTLWVSTVPLASVTRIR